jgi:hypothetical protein
MQQSQSGQKADTFEWLNLWLTGTTSNQNKKSNDYWSERQDLNLRPLRPERSAYFLSL